MRVLVFVLAFSVVASALPTDEATRFRALRTRLTTKGNNNDPRGKEVKYGLVHGHCRKKESADLHVSPKVKDTDKMDPKDMYKALKDVCKCLDGGERSRTVTVSDLCYTCPGGPLRLQP